jgi:hypothetical protein
MPHKHNANRRHHIPKMTFKVRTWPAYEAGLRRRGSLTLWIEAAAWECWQTLGPRGQARYTDVAIQTSQMLRTAFKLALRKHCRRYVVSISASFTRSNRHVVSVGIENWDGRVGIGRDDAREDGEPTAQCRPNTR